MDPVSVRVPEDTNWTCGGCGACCRGFSFGPISERIIEGLVDARIETLWPPAAEQDWYQLQDGPTGRAAYFTKVDDHCIFLRDDNLCAIHATLGAEAKPAFCREFPFHLVRDPRGVTAVIRADCKSWHESFDGAEEVSEAAAEVAAMARVLPVRSFTAEQVQILPGVVLPLASWMAIEDQLASELLRPRAPEEAIAGLRDGLVSRRVFAARAEPERYAMAFRAVLMTLQMVMQRVLREDAPEEQRRGAQEMADAIDRVLAADGALPPLEPRAEAFLAAALRSVWSGRLWVSGGDLAGGLGRWLFFVQCARICCGPEPVSAAEFAEAYHPWRRFASNRTVTWALEKARPALVDLFLAAG